MFAVRGFDDAVFGAAAVAHAEHFALAAVPGQARPLLLAELALLRVFDHFRQRPVVNIADFVFRQHIVIAGVEVAVVFDDRDIPTGRPKDT